MHAASMYKLLVTSFMVLAIMHCLYCIKPLALVFAVDTH